MAHQEIVYKKRKLSIHKASINPSIGQPTVLVTDTWDFVDLWLKQNHKNSARFYWKQAKNFYDASVSLSKVSSPLTLYYCFLNATKALLEAKGIAYKEWHGVSGHSEGEVTTLENEKVNLKSRGILPELAKYLDYPISTNNLSVFSLFDCFYNLPFLHRAFLLTYRRATELFIPIHNPLIVKSKKSNEAWFCAELDENYQDTHSIKKLPQNFERDKGYEDKVIIRCKNRPRRTRWSAKMSESDKIKNYKKYHKKLRKHLFYIHGSPTSWYLKIDKHGNNNIVWHPLILSFAAMHRLSELSRYAPEKLARHFECKQNWLLSEFLKSAPMQFIDEISSEITGLEFKVPKNSF